METARTGPRRARGSAAWGLTVLLLLGLLLPACGSPAKPETPAPAKAPAAAAPAPAAPTAKAPAAPAAQAPAAPAAPAASAAPAAPKKLTKVTFAQSANTLAYAPVYVARKNGYFQEEGIELDLVMATAGSAFQALVSGDAPIVGASTGFIINSLDKNLDLLIVSAISDRVLLTMSMRRDLMQKAGLTATSPVETRLRALKGTTMGITDPGAATDLYLQYALRKAGVDPKKDLDIVALGASSNFIPAIAAKRIGGFMAGLPISYVAQSEGTADIILSGPGGHEPDWVNVLYTTIMTTKGYAAKNPDVVRSFVKAVARGNNFIISSPAEASKAIVSYFKSVPPAAMDLAIKDMVPSTPKGGVITEESMRRLSSLWIKAGESKKEIDPKVGVWWTDAFTK